MRFIENVLVLIIRIFLLLLGIILGIYVIGPDPLPILIDDILIGLLTIKCLSTSFDPDLDVDLDDDD